VKAGSLSKAPALLTHAAGKMVVPKRAAVFAATPRVFAPGAAAVRPLTVFGMPAPPMTPWTLALRCVIAAKLVVQLRTCAPFILGLSGYPGAQI
jgi:hypothetical protein